MKNVYFLEFILLDWLFGSSRWKLGDNFGRMDLNPFFGRINFGLIGCSFRRLNWGFRRTAGFTSSPSDSSLSVLSGLKHKYIYSTIKSITQIN